MATWPAGIDIGDSRIAAGEPVTEDLMKDYRDRDDLCLDYIQANVGYDSWVAQGHLKTALQNPEASVNSGGGPAMANTNFDLDDVGEYGFYPKIKVTNAAGVGQVGPSTEVQIFNWGYGGTQPFNVYNTVVGLQAQSLGGGQPTILYASFRYVTASRHYPTLWLLRNKTGYLKASCFLPETLQKNPPMTPAADEELLVMRLNDNPEFRDHLYKNKTDNVLILGQAHLALFLGILTPDKQISVEDEIAPALTKENVKAVNFKVDWSKL